jgi:hypothetical protein
MDLKETIWNATQGDGGIVEVLLLLRDLAEVKAEDERWIMQNEGLARVWDELAKILDQAAEQATPLLQNSEG